MLHIWDCGVVFLLGNLKSIGKLQSIYRVPQFYIHVYAYISGFYPYFPHYFTFFLEYTNILLYILNTSRVG